MSSLYACFSAVNLSGSYLSGSGKYCSSRCIPRTDTIIGVPFLIMVSVPGILYSLVHSLNKLREPFKSTEEY